jgi:hypothetical protein
MCSSTINQLIKQMIYENLCLTETNYGMGADQYVLMKYQRLKDENGNRISHPDLKYVKIHVKVPTGRTVYNITREVLKNPIVKGLKSKGYIGDTHIATWNGDINSELKTSEVMMKNNPLSSVKHGLKEKINQLKRAVEILNKEDVLE